MAVRRLRPDEIVPTPPVPALPHEVLHAIPHWRVDLTMDNEAPFAGEPVAFTVRVYDIEHSCWLTDKSVSAAVAGPNGLVQVLEVQQWEEISTASYTPGDPGRHACAVDVLPGGSALKSFMVLVKEV